MIPENWNIFKLKDILEKVIDFRGKTPKKIGMNWGEGNIPALSANNVEMGKINLQKESYRGSDLLYKKWMINGETAIGDVVMTMEAPLGNVAQIPDDEKYILSQRVILLKTKEKFIQNNFLKYFLMSYFFRKQLFKNATGTTAKGIKQARLIELDILLPTLKEQEKIASILSIVDNLIENTENLINSCTLLKKGLMQTLLTKGIGHTEFKKTEIGEIPKEWEIKTIENLCEILDSKRVPLNEETRNQMKGNIPYYGANGVVDYINDFIFNEDLILLAEDGGHFSEFKTRPIAYLISGKSWVNNHAHILRPKNYSNLLWIYYNLVHKDITYFIQGGTRTKLNQDSLRKIVLNYPKKIEERDKITSILITVDEQINLFEGKKENLNILKKGLMQQLLTGKIRVKT